MVSLLSVRLNDPQKPGVMKDVRPASGLPVKRRIMGWLTIPFLIALALMASPAALADELQVYQQQCDDAIGAKATVPDFDCDAGTDVPVTVNGVAVTPLPSGLFPFVETCDEPNRLNKECDPGSRFQVLPSTGDAYVVAHCRKKGGGSGNGGRGFYADIAVIQYNRKNGATCFYQALGNNLDPDLPGGSSRPGAPVGEMPVKAPSRGQSAWRWLKPSGTAHIGCAACHDNGPFIRSPYLNQVTGPNALPGSGDTSFNSNQPYAFVGQDFASWKAFKVEITGIDGKKNFCTTCHRLGVSNVLYNNVKPEGTALDFAERATSVLEISDVDSRDAHKTKTIPISVFSPIWMPYPGQFSFNQAHADSARAIHDCAARFHVNEPLPDTDSCRITQFAPAVVAPSPPLPPTPEDIDAIIAVIFAPADIITIINENN